VPRLRLLLPLLVLAFGGAAAPATAATVTRSASGTTAADLDSAVTQFRSDVAPSKAEVAWEEGDLPSLTNPFTYGGLTLTTKGVGFVLDGSGTKYSDPNLLRTNGDTTVDFVVPGTTTPGVTRGFGAVFSGATGNTSKIDLLGADGKSLASRSADPNLLSFVGISITDPRVVEVRITVGTALLDNVIYARPQPDPDRDGIPTAQDNCPTVPNPDQANVDKDSMGDACDPDADNDGVPNSSDAFPLDRTESVDTDGDGIGDNKDPDDDNDGLSDATEGRIGTDPKRADTDGDGVPDGQDNCPLAPNADQADSNGDGRGDACSDSVPPVLSRLKLQPPRFRIGSKNGTRVSFRLSEAAAVRLTVVQLLAGHRTGSRCLKGAPTKDKKGRTRERPCTFSKPMRGDIQRAASGGTNFAKFAGRIGGRWISPGRYALIATATDTAGNPARTSPSAAFTILP
jgi:hypothetical protein